MRKIIVQEFITLDGVMQAPGDLRKIRQVTSNMVAGLRRILPKLTKRLVNSCKNGWNLTDLLLGRKTFEIFAAYWPEHAEMWPGINDVTKYVVSTTMDESDMAKSDWKNSVLLKNVDDVRKLKNSEGSPIKVHGSGTLAQTLLKNDLVDESAFDDFPVTLGTGKRLFGEWNIPAAFKLTDSLVTSNGVIFAYYERGGEVKTGTVGA